ncbi:hypothetical protein D3C83_132790 [compost metagenome]
MDLERSLRHARCQSLQTRARNEQRAGAVDRRKVFRVRLERIVGRVDRREVHVRSDPRQLTELAVRIGEE